MIEIRHDKAVLHLLLHLQQGALTAYFCRRFLDLVEAAQSDESIRAIVVSSVGKQFSSAIDLTEIDDPALLSSLRALTDGISQSGKPVIAAIQDEALGVALEIALACHYRVAGANASLGLPDVKLGLIPAAGGAQRLPRIIGQGPALEMMVGGEPITGRSGLDLGLIDRMVEDSGHCVEAALDLAGVVEISPDRSARDAVARTEGFERLAAESAAKYEGQPAPLACMAAVRNASQLPFAEADAIDKDAFARLFISPQSKALRHIRLAEQTSSVIENAPRDLIPRPIRRVGVIGAGTMGSGIALVFLSAGIEVTLIDMTAEALTRGVAQIGSIVDDRVSRARLKPEEGRRTIALLASTLDFRALADCDLVVEAVYESMDIKKELFTTLDSIVKPGAILASNTSYLDINAIAAVTDRPSDVLGLHFFSPANVMKLVEIVRGAQTGPDVLATAIALAVRIGKQPVIAGVCHGFIGNRMLIPRRQNADALLLEGAPPDQIDRVHTAFGMPMGPFGMTDLAGVDVGWHRDPSKVGSIREALCAEGRLGQKVRAGFYDYDERRRASPSLAAGAIIDRFRATSGIVPRSVTDDEITVRTIYTMINEGLKILDEGIAQRPSDIDVVWVHGYGWPRTTGGPMYWAGTLGLDRIAAGLDRYRDRLGPDFSLSPRLADQRA